MTNIVNRRNVNKIGKQVILYKNVHSEKKTTKIITPPKKKLKAIRNSQAKK